MLNLSDADVAWIEHRASKLVTDFWDVMDDPFNEDPGPHPSLNDVCAAALKEALERGHVKPE